MSMRLANLMLALIVALALGCSSTSVPGDVLRRQGDEISVCGQLIHTGTRVVLWNDPGGYDAYRAQCRFTPDRPGPSDAPDRIARYGSFRRGIDDALRDSVRSRGWHLEELQGVVSQVVLHYDACGTSRRCFEVLHDIRGLSCHFLLDLDGTVYQTLDLKERAWHAGVANDRSIGIEIANIGALADTEQLHKWYVADDAGVRFQWPEELGPSGLPSDFVARPARPGVFAGEINGRVLYQYDFTEEQYRALERLLQTLCRVFPSVEPQLARPLDRVFTDPDRIGEFRGILAHSHVTAAKFDPGPAFDWERIERALASSSMGQTP